MGENQIVKLMQMVPNFLEHEHIDSLYDKEADVLYINFEKPSLADDSEMIDNDVIVRYIDERVVGITIKNASKRKNLVK